MSVWVTALLRLCALFVCVCVCLCLCVSECLCVWVSAYMCVRACVYMSVCVLCMCVCVYTHLRHYYSDLIVRYVSCYEVLHIGVIFVHNLYTHTHAHTHTHTHASNVLQDKAHVTSVVMKINAKRIRFVTYRHSPYLQFQ